MQWVFFFSGLRLIQYCRTELWLTYFTVQNGAFILIHLRNVVQKHIAWPKTYSSHLSSPRWSSMLLKRNTFSFSLDVSNIVKLHTFRIFEHKFSQSITIEKVVSVRAFRLVYAAHTSLSGFRKWFSLSVFFLLRFCFPSTVWRLTFIQVTLG